MAAVETQVALGVSRCGVGYLIYDQEMNFDPDAQERVERAAELLTSTGASTLLGKLVGEVWINNVARFEPAAGDTSRSLGFLSAENIAQRANRLSQTDQEWKAVGLEAVKARNTVEFANKDVRFHLVKAPVGSAMSPDWFRDFKWTTQVRLEAAEAVSAVYRAPYADPTSEPLFPVRGGGDATLINDFFVVWAGQRGEEPRTRGWLIIPSAGPNSIIAAADLWADETDRTQIPIAPQGPAADDTDIELPMRLKKAALEQLDGR